MKLAPDDCAARLAAHDHGVLCTVHAVRGVDAVPVAFAVDGDVLAVPVDTVKPKSGTRLQRQANLERDPRATLLVEHWDAGDWSRLWWVRAELRYLDDPSPDLVAALADRLAARYPQYRERPFDHLLLLRVVGLSGWAAQG